MNAETEAKGCATNDGRKRKRRYLPHNVLFLALLSPFPFVFVNWVFG